MKLEEILEIADKNGFDWWGMKKIRIKVPVFTPIRWLELYTIVFKEGESTEEFERKFSLADLATNKSFLEALQLYRFNHYTNEATIVLWKYYQNRLVLDLTENNGKDFWKICSEFVGGKAK